MKRRESNNNGGESNGGDGGNSGEEGSGSHKSGATEGEERFCKIELPIFTGEDALGWIGKIERYFRYRGLSEREKMEAVFVAVEGKALSWMQWWES